MHKLFLASAAAATALSGLGASAPAFAQSGPPAPGGTYRTVCQNIQFNGAVLTAECKDAVGSYHQTTLPTAQCRGDIGDQNGTLACAGAQGTAGPVIGQGQQAQSGNNQGGYGNRGNNQGGYGGNNRGGYGDNNQGGYDSRGDNRGDNGVASALIGALIGPPPPQPPTYGDRRYGDPRYDWRYQQGGYGYGRRPGEWVPITQRADWLNRQIDGLQRDGRIDDRDARDYRRQLDQIQRREFDLQRSGRLGSRQRDELDRSFSQLTEEIRHDATEQ